MKKFLSFFVFSTIISFMSLKAQPPAMIWASTYGDSATAEFSQILDIASGEDGAIYVVGYMNFYPHGDYLFLKYNSENGNVLRKNGLDGNPDDPNNNNDIAMGCAFDPQGYLFVVGMSSNSQGTSGFLTAKIDASNGDTVWTRRYDGLHGGAGVECALDGLGNLYVGGMLNNGSYTDFCLLKYDSEDGNLLWYKTYASPYTDKGEVYGCTTQGSDVYINGYVINDETYYLYTVKCDSTGGTIWTKLNAEGLDSLQYIHSDCITDTAGNVYVTGNGSDSITGTYGITIKYSADGDLLWKKFYDKSLNDFTYGCTIDMGGNLIAVGAENMTGNFHNGIILMIRYNSETGDTIWTDQVSRGRYAISCIVDNSGYLYLCGVPYYWGCLTMKFENTGLVGINEELPYNLQSSIYPNPFSEYAIIEFNYDNSSSCSLNVFDMTGRQVSRYENINTGKVLLTKKEFNKGMYFYQICNNNNVLNSGKFIVE